jgi:hypothetical protein
MDTSSSFSILPHRSRLPLRGPALKSANGGCIRCWGYKQSPIAVGGQPFSWKFLLADVRFAILGIDFLRHHQLVVHVFSEQLLPRAVLAAPVAGDVFAVADSKAAPASQPSEWTDLLSQFPRVTKPFEVRYSPAHGVEHSIETVGRPATAKFRRLDPVRLAAAKEEFQRMLDAGVIPCSQSCWSSPLHMVRKKDSGWRPCGDFCHLNFATTDDKYPLPNMGDLSSRLDGCTIFTKLDLQKGYFQVPVAAGNVPKTAIITPCGLFEFLCMPFGLKNAGMTFQRLMDRIFFDLAFTFVYLDDLLIASQNVEDYLDFFGHSVSAAGVAPLPSRVEAIRNFPRPAVVRELQAFLGLFNFYRLFVHRAAAIVKPLTDALRGSLAPTAAIKWSAEMVQAFAAASADLGDTALLEHPSAADDISLATDASATHIGAALQQRPQGGTWKPLGFFYRSYEQQKPGIARLTGSCWLSTTA